MDANASNKRVGFVCPDTERSGRSGCNTYCQYFHTLRRCPTVDNKLGVHLIAVPDVFFVLSSLAAQKIAYYADNNTGTVQNRIHAIKAIFLRHSRQRTEPKGKAKYTSYPFIVFEQISGRRSLGNMRSQISVNLFAV